VVALSSRNETESALALDGGVSTANNNPVNDVNPDSLRCGLTPFSGRTYK